MKTSAARLAFALCAALLPLLLCSCEEDKVREKWDDAKDKISGSDEKSSEVTAAGTWTGTAWKGGAKTVLVLTDKDGRLSFYRYGERLSQIRHISPSPTHATS